MKNNNMSSQLDIRKTIQFVAIILICGFVFSGCLPKSNSQPSTEVQDAAVKSGDTTLTGTITGSGGSFVLTNPGQSPVSIDSYSVDLNMYVGQQVTITGQYSGDTLFVRSIN